MLRSVFRPIATLAAAFLVGAIVVPTPVSAYMQDWTRSPDAISYAYKGLHEKYVLGGKTFIDNDIWDSNEGIDCSSYVSKVWAIPNYYAPTDVVTLYTTYNFYYQTTYWNHEPVTGPYLMEGFVWRAEAGGPTSGHTGLFRIQNSGGEWITWEARGSSYGVVSTYRDVYQLDNWNALGIDRKDWG